MKKALILSVMAMCLVVLSGCSLLPSKPVQRACTLEAKICPDGSSVGRQGPNCEFSECPVATSSQSVGLANPASVNCKDKGGNLVIQKGPKGEYGLCFFDDNRACEEWAMMRGDCPVGGVKTTGYDTEAQKFCAWSGGSTFAVANAVCTFKDGSKCLADDFYNGSCNKGDQFPTSFQTYRDSKYGFEFQYPREWPIPVMMAGGYTGGYPQTTSDWRLAVGPVYSDYYNNKGYAIYLAGFSNINYVESLKALRGDELISNIKEKTINGNRVIVFNESGIVDFTNALIFGPTQTIEFQYNGNSDLASGFQKTLETFKFEK